MSVFELSPARYDNVTEPWRAKKSASHSRTVLIDSRDRDYDKYPTPSIYRIRLPTVYRNVTSARLVSAEVPSTFYIFTAAAQNTTLKVTSSAPNTSYTISIPDGNYTQTSVTSAIQTVLNATAQPDGLAFSVTVDAATSKLRIACTSHASTTVSVDTTSAPSKPTEWGLGYFLGFQRGTVRSGTGSVTAPSLINMNPVTYILLSIRQMDRVDEAGLYGSGEPKAVFAKIPCNVNSFEYAFFDKLLTDNTMNPPIGKLDALDISFRFHDGTLVNFNGCEHSLTIELMCTESRETSE
jgi:hypothetical protein